MAGTGPRLPKIKIAKLPERVPHNPCNTCESHLKPGSPNLVASYPVAPPTFSPSLPPSFLGEHHAFCCAGRNWTYRWIQNSTQTRCSDAPGRLLPTATLHAPGCSFPAASQPLGMALPARIRQRSSVLCRGGRNGAFAVRVRLRPPDSSKPFPPRLPDSCRSLEHLLASTRCPPIPCLGRHWGRFVIPRVSNIPSCTHEAVYPPRTSRAFPWHPRNPPRTPSPRCRHDSHLRRSCGTFCAHAQCAPRARSTPGRSARLSTRVSSHTPRQRTPKHLSIAASHVQLFTLFQCQRPSPWRRLPHRFLARSQP